MQLLMDALKFDRLLTPTYIKYIYWGAVVCVVIGSVFGLLASISNFSIGGIVGSLISGIIGLVMLRISCEVTLVLFLIEARLRELNQRVGGGR